MYPFAGDVGGQRTLRPYWRNYFEQTDALVWVVDSGDRMRMIDCKEELHGLLLEDVRLVSPSYIRVVSDLLLQRLAGASLLVFANKQDIQGSMSSAEIRDVRDSRINNRVSSFGSNVFYRLWTCPLSSHTSGRS